MDTRRPGPSTPSRRAAELEAAALALKERGYNSAVVTARMIQEHEMEEAEAVELVGRIYGKKVNPRAGDTTSGVVSGIAMVVLGLGGAWTVYFVLPLLPFILRVIVAGAALAFAGAGATRVITTLVNSNVKEDLRER